MIYDHKIAVHMSTGSFSAGWVSYCNKNNISYRVVDCFSTGIIDQLRGCHALLWHWEHHDYRAALFARQLIASIEAMGVLVFPSLTTSWHYDDKVGQKYLLEAVGAPVVPSHVFYDCESALRWLEKVGFPLVWKLRNGAGSQNVRLIRDFAEARKVIGRSFGRGWKDSRFHAFNDRVWQFRRDPGVQSLVNIGRGIARAILPHEKSRDRSVERGYVYFQDFVPGNDSDIRVIIIGNRAFAIKRMVRKGDFRASGSGRILYDEKQIPFDCLRIAFDVTQKIKSQCCAFDFVCRGGEWMIVEISYAFSLKGYLDCPGYWDRDLNWYPGKVEPERFMMEDVLDSLRVRG